MLNLNGANEFRTNGRVVSANRCYSQRTKIIQVKATIEGIENNSKNKLPEISYGVWLCDARITTRADHSKLF